MELGLDWDSDHENFEINLRLTGPDSLDQEDFLRHAAAPSNIDQFEGRAEVKRGAEVARASAALTDYRVEGSITRAWRKSRNGWTRTTTRSLCVAAHGWVLMDAVRVCTLGQITEAFFEVGGLYRRNI